MGTAAKATRENRTITGDVRDETTSFRLMADGQTFLECVPAFILSLGFQRTYQFCRKFAFSSVLEYVSH
jgi:hypothetical protein